jgi:hypothetical protein
LCGGDSRGTLAWRYTGVKWVLVWNGRATGNEWQETVRGNDGISCRFPASPALSVEVTDYSPSHCSGSWKIERNDSPSWESISQITAPVRIGHPGVKASHMRGIWLLEMAEDDNGLVRAKDQLQVHSQSPNMHERR